jgi:hypothetical protein
MTTTSDPRERQARIAALWQHRPDSDYETIAAEADAQLAAEAAERAEADARAREFGESLTAMAYTCAVCGQTRDPAARDALCEPCRRVVWQVRSERAAAEQVSGSTRRALAEQYVDSRG